MFSTSKKSLIFGAIAVLQASPKRSKMLYVKTNIICVWTLGRDLRVWFTLKEGLCMYTLFGMTKPWSMVLLHAVPGSFKSEQLVPYELPSKNILVWVSLNNDFFSKPTQTLGFFHPVYQWWVFSKSRTEHWLCFTCVREKPGKTYLLWSIPSCKFIFDTYRNGIGFLCLFWSPYKFLLKGCLPALQNCISCSSPRSVGECCSQKCGAVGQTHKCLRHSASSSPVLSSIHKYLHGWTML